MRRRVPRRSWSRLNGAAWWKCKARSRSACTGEAVVVPRRRDSIRCVRSGSWSSARRVPGRASAEPATSWNIVECCCERKRFTCAWKACSVSLRSSIRNATFYPVILAGGRGTRFWPLSRKRLAKQLLPLNSKQTMIQETVERLLPLAPENISGSSPTRTCATTSCASCRSSTGGRSSPSPWDATPLPPSAWRRSSCCGATRTP